MAKAFASQGDMTEKKITFDEIGEGGLYAFTAEGDPNSGVIIGDESVMIVEAQATPRLAGKVIECVRSVTDKPISHVVLTHYHAVRVLGASAFGGASQIIMSDVARSMVVERGQEDWDSEFQRFPRLFEGHESIPGLTWPTTTFSESMTVYLATAVSISCRSAAPIPRAMRSFTSRIRTSCSPVTSSRTIRPATAAMGISTTGGVIRWTTSNGSTSTPSLRAGGVERWWARRP